MTKFKFGRRLDSYSKVRHLLSRIRRNRRFQLNTLKVQSSGYLDIGCGNNVHAEFVNLDYMWHPGVDVCWDIRLGLPFENNRFAGVFSEHCLEHFDMEDGEKLCREVFRVLTPGACFRVVVPSADLYLKTYNARALSTAEMKFPFESKETYKGKFYTPMLSVNRVFYQDRDSTFGHRCMYDYELMSALLKYVGFSSVNQSCFRVGNDSNLLIDSPIRECESLYIEAFK